MERPEVTVVDPARRHLPGEPAVERRSHGRARVAALAAAGLVLAAGTLAGLDARADRQVAASEERAARLVALEATTVGFREQAFVDDPTGRVDVSVFLAIRNAGPLPVRLVGAALGTLTATTDEVVAPRSTAVVHLKGSRPCPSGSGGEPDPDDLSQGLLARLRTSTSARVVPVESSALPLARLATLAARSCGFRPLEEAVQVSGGVADASGRTARVVIDLDNTSVRRVRVRSLALGPGLVVQAIDGRPAQLPFELATATAGTTATTRLDVEVGVDCRRLAVNGPSRLGEVLVVVDDGDGALVGPLSGPVGSADLLRQLAARTCASGSRAS